MTALLDVATAVPPGIAVSTPCCCPCWQRR